MNFSTSVILIISVAYILYIAYQLHADYKKSRPLEGQTEEHFTFNPDNPVNVNSVKVTMDQDGISLLPEQPTYFQPLIENEESLNYDQFQKSSVTTSTNQSTSSNSTTQSNNSNSTTQTTSQQQSQSSVNQGSSSANADKAQSAEEIEAELRRKMKSHTMEYMSSEYTSEGLMKAVERGDMIDTEVIEELDEEDSEENSYDNQTVSTAQEQVNADYEDYPMTQSQDEEFEEDSLYPEDEEQLDQQYDGQEYGDSDYQGQDYDVDNDYYDQYDYNQDDDVPELDLADFLDSDEYEGEDLRRDMNSKSY